MNLQPRTQFELSEHERDQKPEDVLEQMQRRRRMSMAANRALFDSFVDAGEYPPPPEVSDEQAIEYAAVIVAAFRRLVCDVDWACRRRGSVDSSIVVSSALLASQKVLEEVATWKPEGSTNAVA